MKLLYLATIAGLMFTLGCEPKTKVEYVEVYVEKEKIVEVPADSGLSDTDEDPNAINLTGSLNLGSGGGGALGLTGGLGLADTTTPYSLSCVTFSDSPKSFTIDVKQGANGYVFSGTLANSAGESFGCFLLEEGQVLAPLVFGADGSSLLAGAGELKFAINYNKETKAADASVDQNSSALSTDAIADAKKAKNVTETDLTKLNSTYKLACAIEAGMECDEDALPSSEIYFRHFKVGEKDKVALWQSKTARDQCTSGAGSSDAQPSFNMKIGTTTVAMDYTTENKLKESLDTAFSTLKSETAGSMQQVLASMIESRARQNISWRSEQCSNNAINAGNCKFVLGEIDTYSWTDYYTNETHTYSYPRWHDLTSYDSLSDYAGTVTTKALPCKTYWTPNGEVCPLGTATDEDGVGSYNAFFGTDNDGSVKRLRLLCRDYTGSSNLQHQEWAMGNTKANAMSAAVTAAGCDTITDAASPYNNEITAFRDEVRNRMSEIAAFGLYNTPDDICRNNQLASTFRVTDCVSSMINQDIKQLNYVYWEKEKPSWIDATMEQMAEADGVDYISYFSKDWSQAEFCRDLNNWLLSSWNMRIDYLTQTLVDADDPVDLSNNTIYPYQAQEVCPAHVSGLTDIYTELDSATCMGEFFAVSAEEQIKRIQKVRIGDYRPLQYLACPDSTNRDAVVSGLKQQCLPQAFTNWVCDNTGNCRQNLQCAGTKGGKCYDANGTFVGNITGRLAVMDAKAGVNNAFGLFNTVKDEWMAWDSENQQMKACKMTNDTVLNAKFNYDFSFGVSYLKQKFRQECREATDSDMSEGGANSGGTTGTAAGNGQQNNSTKEIPETDTLSKLNLKRCENHTCN